MKVTVYRQAIKEREDGTIIGKGEDTRPYADDGMIMVADGLGGAAAIRHQKFDPDMFEPEKIVDVMLNGIYEDYSDTRLVEYIKKSFEELYAVKNCYTDNINNMKKGGYFGSRILSAIILHELFYSEDIKEFRFFSKLNEAKAEEKDEILNEISKHFTELISEKLKVIAKKCNLVYESSYMGLALLGSTLCATLLHETEDSVECIYLTAGDSRPYVWSSDLGLMQVLPDEEGNDGGMTNYILANEDRDFKVHVQYQVFAKPCVIFNASDGCFDSGEFVSQMAFELLLMNSIMESKDCDELETTLTSFFEKAGKHDDSSTIAMNIYGYSSFEELKAAAQKRLEKLNEEYLSQMDGLLETDYIEQHKAVLSQIDKAFTPFKSRLAEEKAIDEWCGAEVTNGHCESYNKGREELKKKIEAIEQSVKDAKEIIGKIVRDNYSRFLSLTDTEKVSKIKQFSTDRAIDKIDKIDEKHEEAVEQFSELLEDKKKELEETAEKIKTILQQIYDIGAPEDYDEYLDVDFTVITECEKSMVDLFEFFTKIRKRKLESINKIAQSRKAYIERNNVLADENSDKVRDIIEVLVRDYHYITGIRISETEKKVVIEAVNLIEQALKEKDKIENEDMPLLFEKSKKEHWDKNFIRISKEVIYENESEYKISDGLLTEVKAALDKLDSDAQELREKAQLQKELFDKYDKGYFTLMEGDN